MRWFCLVVALSLGCATSQPRSEPTKEDNTKNGEKAALVLTLIIAISMAAIAVNRK